MCEGLGGGGAQGNTIFFFRRWTAAHSECYLSFINKGCSFFALVAKTGIKKKEKNSMRDVNLNSLSV